MQNNYGKWIALIVVLVLLLGAAALLKNSNENKGITVNDNQSQDSLSPEDAGDVVNEAGTTTGGGQGSTGGNTQAYNDALKMYDGRRIQFDEFCAAVPKNITFKSGTRIMLDNRSDDSRRIVLDGTVYNIPRFGYRIVTLPTVTTTSKTLQMNCADLVNVGTILLQK